jgi:hypothetical protein
MATIQMGDIPLEEVKTTLVEGEGALEDTSTTEETQEAETSSEEDTSEKTVEAETSDDSNDELNTKHKELEALVKTREELLNEITSLRSERRELRKPNTQPLMVEKDDFNDVAEEDVKIVEKIAKKLGFVRKDELQGMSFQEKINSFQNSWLDKHPEYLPANDPEDKKWNSLQREYQELFDGIPPKDPNKIVERLDLIHRKINPMASLPIKNRAVIAAAKEKVESTNKTGGAKTTQSARTTKIDKSVFSGFTAEELAEFDS